MSEEIKPLSVLMITPSYVPAYVYGGPTRSMAALSEHLKRHGMHVEVYTTNANGAENLPYPSGFSNMVMDVPVTYFHRWTGDHSHFSPRLLWFVWKRARKADIVHLHSWWNMVTMPAVVICLVRGVRPVLSIRGTLSSFSFTHSKSGLKQLFHRLIGLHLLRKTLLHATSDKERDEVLNMHEDLLCDIVPNFVDFPIRSSVEYQSRDKFRMIFLGRIDRVKNIDFVLDVMKELPGSDIELHIVGETQDPEYLIEIQQRSSQLENIYWHGNIMGEEKWSMLANSDLLLLPSKTENFANVVIESLSQGTAVLLSDQVGLKNYVRSNRLGWVEPLSIDIWRDRITSIMSDRQALDSIREKGPEDIRRDFDSKVVAYQYYNMYQRHLARS